MTNLIRAQYHFRPSERGLLAWDVRRLVDLSEHLPVLEIPLAEIAEFEEEYWYAYSSITKNKSLPTPSSIIEHMRLVNAASLDYPILLDAQGRLLDGMHRICKAHLLSHSNILTKRFVTTPEPDYVDCHPGELPYDD